MVESVIIVGAGIAGLGAGLMLAGAGVPVTLLEAGDRVGGRMRTIFSQPESIPVELGAEFVHGARTETWELLEAFGLGSLEVSDRHWRARNGRLESMAPPWNTLRKVFETIDAAAPDRDFASHLRQTTGLTEGAQAMARMYVEGFHAAAIDRIGTRALAKAEHAAELDDGAWQFRLSRGYGALLDALQREIEQRGARIRCGVRAQQLRWGPRQVTVLAEMMGKAVTFSSTFAVVTLPLGVLQLDGVRFDPPLKSKRAAIRGLAMGPAVRITLRFPAAFLPVENSGWIHSPETHFRTWWSDSRLPLLTAWAGGPQTRPFIGKTSAERLAIALAEAARILGVDPASVRQNLAGAFTHDWSEDPFARGGYSYTPAGMEHLPGELGRPLEETLFFAGEATDDTGEQGTVQGALASGRRAARRMLALIQGRQLVASAER